MIDSHSILDIMDRADTVYLATVNGAAPRIRAMVNLRRPDLFPVPSRFCRAEGFAVYFCTSAASGKVREVRANPAAAAYFSLPQEFRGVMLSGTAEVLDDLELRKTLWDDGWRIYWPEGPSDPDCIILRLRPDEATGWWGSQSFYRDLRDK